ncbi:MAG: glyoxalase/bleomycin resistance/dioxygenase family protein [Acidobacteria bacterium]|nr:glyoxalase/bleomycin resistance/dioxygenase family protein [Acidobacteriota bacterium]
MSRLQLALNVSNLEEAVSFYTAFFKTEPAKVRAGYANFAIAEPPLKLVLFENLEAPGTINHLGVEVFSSEEVVDATTYLSDQGFETDIEVQTSCWHAVQNKVWVDGPDGSRWEVYTVLSDVPASESATEDELCCVPERLSISAKPAACC